MSTSPIGGLIDPASFPPAIVDPTQSMDLNVIGQSPSPGSGASGPIGEVSVQFDRPVDPFSLGWADVHIARIEADGTTTPVVDDNSLLTESLDSSGTILTETLSQALTPGTYRLVLSANAFLMGTDGSLLSSLGTETPLGGFSILPAAPTLADATDLGALSSNVTSAIGHLDLQSNPHDVAIYRFEVTPQYALSRVGIEVSAQRIGSSLDAALVLLNSDGSTLGYYDVGRPGAPADPYLFQGLKAGVYYVAVVGSQMGYGPTGHFDAADPPLPQGNSNPVGGIYTIQLVADPGDTPAAMIGFGLLHQDPLNPNPTGFTLQFNAPLALTDPSGNIFDVMSRGVQVLDAHGQSWPVAAVAYNEAESTLTYVFRQELPAGSYSVRIPSTGGLVDLSGHTPTAYGHAGGLFGTFSVSASPSQSGANDLGTLYPDDILSNASHTIVVPAGGTVSLRFAILYSDLYKITALQEGGTLTATILDPAEPTDLGSPVPQPLTLGDPGVESSFYHNLDWGVHVLTLTNSGSRPVVFRFQLGIGTYRWESLLQGGIGQGPALGLRLIAPGVSSSAPATPAASSSTAENSAGAGAMLPAAFAVMTSGFVSGTHAESNTPVPSGLSTPALPATTPATGLYLAIAGQPIGSPTISPTSGAAAAPSFVSLGGTGFGQSIGPASLSLGTSAGSSAPVVENVPGTGVTPEDEVAPSDELAALVEATRNPDKSIGDVVLAAPSSVAAKPTTTDGSLPGDDAGMPWVPLPEERTLPEEAKALDPGLALCLVAAVAIHYRKAIRGWVSRFRRQNVRTRRVAPDPAPRKRPSTRSREESLGSSRISRLESRERMVAL